LLKALALQLAEHGAEKGDGGHGVDLFEGHMVSCSQLKVTGPKLT
jgi:hypothetical protein